MRATDLRLTRGPGGPVVVSGVLNNLFGDAASGPGTGYAILTITNRHASQTLTGIKAWLVLDPGGATVAIAALTPSAGGGVDATTGSYTTPTDRASGITLPDLAPGASVHVGIRRVLTGAAVAYPENNRILVAGTAPA